MADRSLDPSHKMYKPYRMIEEAVDEGLAVLDQEVINEATFNDWFDYASTIMEIYIENIDQRVFLEFLKMRMMLRRLPHIPWGDKIAGGIKFLMDIRSALQKRIKQSRPGFLSRLKKALTP